MTITLSNISQHYFGCHISQRTVHNFGTCVKIFLLLLVSNGVVMESQMKPAR